MVVERTPEEIKKFEALLAKHRPGTTYAEFQAQQFPHQSSNPIGDVLEGENVAAPLIEAASAGNLPKLQSMLVDPFWVDIALKSQHYVVREMRPVENKHDTRVRPVATEEHMSVEKAILAAAKSGHAEVVSLLFAFETRHNVCAVSRRTIITSIENNRINVLEALDKVEPSFLFWHLDFKHTSLDLAIMHKNVEMVRRMLELMNGHKLTNGQYKYRDDHRSGRLRHAARSTTPEILQLLLDNGYTIRGSGALHGAAECNALEMMRFLVDQGADVNEICPAGNPAGSPSRESWHKSALLANWVPMHFAARYGKEKAVELLEGLGAKTDVRDINGKTPREFLDEWKASKRETEEKQKQEPERERGEKATPSAGTSVE